ncbi:Ldh family oxidoreductase [Gulosibacter sp. 10]|uniref:Ldh family oxidoreductase n=1 Tax=Gulosibacter sp. 10 TaxID=1255570 RepID=UPI000B3593B9|nr:Ldh family oxidoreductase [Gulosibacter sp. 10]
MRTTVQDLLALTAELLVDRGLARDRAERTAKVLVQAELWGIGSHGVLRLPIYLDRLAEGGHPADADLTTVDDTGPLLTLDGNGGLGHWQLAEATSRAVERAGRYGIAAAGVANSGHCGALGVYAAQIADVGMAGLVFSCGPAALPAWGGRTALLSTSPIAAGFPMPGGNAIIDLAMSTVARGKIAAHARAGEPLPDGWALDADGEPTNDPVAALTGMLSPLGGAKGFALAFMVEALTAGLVGPLLSADVPDFFDREQYGASQRIAHLVIVLDPARTGAGGDAEQRLGELAERTAQAGGRVPGSRRRSLEQVEPDTPIDIADDLWEELTTRREPTESTE